MIAKTWVFRLSALAFLVLITPVLGIYLHAPAGFYAVLALATLVGLFEDRIRQGLQRTYLGIARNKLLVLFAAWYAVGAVLNILVDGKGLADWRLMLTPITMVVGLLFGFIFITDDLSWRYFQIVLIIALGLQSILAIPQLYSNPGLTRTMWDQSSGSGMIYGDQSYFSLSVILLPLLIWRSFIEKGRLRILLVASCCLILVSALISSFGTPLGLIIIGLVVTFILAVFFMLRRMGWLFAVLIVLVGYYGYLLTSNNMLFSESYTRIENFINDPTSGGYSGKDVDQSRWYLDQISITSFQSNPIFGMGGGSTRYSPFVGGHSSLLDNLGAYGLFGGGGALAAMMLVLLLNAITGFVRQRNWQSLLTVTSVIVLLVAGIVNPYWEGLQPLFVILVVRSFTYGSGPTVAARQPSNLTSLSSTPFQSN